jgi:prefoldin subunit 5
MTTPHLIETLQKQIDGLKDYIETLEQAVSNLSNQVQLSGQELDDTHQLLVEALALVESHYQLMIIWRSRYEAATGTTGPSQG